ncbi:hypothetical protein RD792_010293 [Penstemon davidsonii]|uniref:Protein kinase domain-containing protein n=1 Tax=Penstemon davidsonii TaxID=160366 RepID=A0ABR0D1F2_9LAMI|nr:hypothetical protein RD792_010293 [Penstemon davidsonii]
MKKIPSPLIIRRGSIRKPRANSFNCSPVGKDTATRPEKPSTPALKYIISAAKRVSGVFSAILFGRRKVDSKSNRDQVDSKTRNYQSGEDSYSLNSSTSRNAQFRSSLTFEEVYKATENFSPANKIGEGGFGTVYKGILKNGSIFAVKRAKRETYDQRLSVEFKNEILALSKIEHLSLVRFYGYIEHGNELLIVVEYVSNGTLREHLDGTHGSGLETTARLDIAIDIAHAVTYLHTYTDPPIIHRDIKSSNILITENFRAKVADFGFARLGTEDSLATHISTQIKGTAGYLDPEYLKTYQLTEKSDVYSFGVLLVEMMTGRNPIENRRSLDERVTIRWVSTEELKRGEVVNAMDERLQRSVASIQAVENVLKLARQCLAASRISRPSMRKCAEILWEIRKELRENTLSNSASTSFQYSPNVIGRNTRKNREKDSDLDFMFVSA